LEVTVAGEDGAGPGLNGALERQIVLCEDDGVGSCVSEGGDAVQLGGRLLGGADEFSKFASAQNPCAHQ
jgi:hypothetical protein